PKADPPPEDDRLLRLAAEYDNFRKRTIKEKVTLRDTALRETAIEFLPVYDNLERALKQETEDAAYKKGVEMTMTQLKTIFEKLELEKIPSLGELFDPNLHNAVTHVDDDRWGENTITEVFQEGFTHKDTVIRFAMVKVAN
ncbi:MAG: nucleotide exchange factor GrpE, partial [Eubacteriales bacterium]